MLPPGVDAKTFAAALDAFKEAVGSQWVFTSPDDAALYRDAYSVVWGEPEERLASAAVAPQTVEQVQKVVVAANKYKIPIYPVSTGKNLGYGGSAPNLSGSVVLDLKRMDQVIEVDDRRHYAIVEPGVSYFDLYRYIQERGLKVWIDTPDPGWGSPVGNAIDHGSGYTYGLYRDHFYAHCGMEVVLPNGELLRTGMGALPGAKTWGDFQFGTGPYVDGLFSQSNFGVVTKMGFRLMPPPDAYMNGTVFVPKRNDLIPLIDEINYLEDLGLIGQPLYGAPLRAIAAANELARKPGFPTDAQLDQIASDNHVPSWTCQLQFYGPATTVRANWEYAQQRLRAAIPGATFKEGVSYRFPLTPEQKAAVPHKVAIGIPNLAIFSLGARTERNPTPSDGEAWFSPVIPRSGEGLFEGQRVFSGAVKDVKLPQVFSAPGGRDYPYGPFNGPSTFMPFTYYMISAWPISRSDPEHNKQVREVINHLILRGRRSRLRGLSRSAGIPGRNRQSVHLQQSCLAPFSRASERRRGPQWHHLGRPLWHLAQAHEEDLAMWKSAIVLSLCLIVSGPALAADAALIQEGNAQFQLHCAPCHGKGVGNNGAKMLPGTEALTVKYKGIKPGLLEERTDLSPEIVKYFVRHGVSVMAFFRKTEISDSELDAIAAYLSRNYKPDADKK